MTKQQAKQAQQTTLIKLRLVLESGEQVNTKHKYFVSLPLVHAHGGHPLGTDACGFAQRIHPLLTKKISELVASGITDTAEVKHHIQFYVRNTIPSELELKQKQAIGHFILQQWM